MHPEDLSVKIAHKRLPVQDHGHAPSANEDAWKEVFGAASALIRRKNAPENETLLESLTPELEQLKEAEEAEKAEYEKLLQAIRDILEEISRILQNLLEESQKIFEEEQKRFIIEAMEYIMILIDGSQARIAISQSQLQASLSHLQILMAKVSRSDETLRPDVGRNLQQERENSRTTQAEIGSHSSIVSALEAQLAGLLAELGALSAEL